MHEHDQEADRSHKKHQQHASSYTHNQQDNNQNRGKAKESLGIAQSHVDIDEEIVFTEEGNEDLDEAEEMDFGELDLQGITDTCARKEANYILEKHIQLLQSVLLKSKTIYSGS